MFIFIFFVVIWYSSLFFHSFFLHRYASHGAFKMSKGWEKVFFILSYVTQGSSYMSPRAYAIMHRLHHAYADTELDPHSPKYSSNIFAMFWRSRTVYRAIINETMEIEERFTRNLPEWKSFDRWAVSWASTFMWIGIYVAIVASFATSPWMYLILLPLVSIAAVQGAAINWYAHRYGHVSYEMKNTSRNLFSVDVFFLGESYHNNHHKFPSSINFGRKWHEIDPIYYAIRLLVRMRVISMAKKPVAQNAEEHSRSLVSETQF